jgi:hypothetical protein
MRCVTACVVAVFAAVVACCGIAAASVEPIEDGSAAPTRMLLFSGIDLWRNGGFSHGGFLWAHQGLDADGVVFKLLLNGGAYRYHSGFTQIVGSQAMAAALPGWRFRRAGFEFTVFGGLDVQHHGTTPVDPGNRLRGTHAGVRGGFDVWYEPFQNAMVTASASLSTVGSSYWTRGAAGWRFLDSIWLGPEFLACGDDTYRQFRAGAHVTSLRFGSYEFSVGAGYVTDSDRRSGVYGRLGMLFRLYERVGEPDKPVPF